MYLNETCLADMFSLGGKNYKENSTKFDRGEDCIQRHLYERFQLPGHTGFLQDTSVKTTW